jgi:Tol biopolymer transport system component
MKYRVMLFLTFIVVLAISGITSTQPVAAQSADHVLTNILSTAWSPNADSNWIAVGGYQSQGTLDTNGIFQFDPSNQIKPLLYVSRADDPGQQINLEQPTNERGAMSIVSVDWSPDGRYLVSGNATGTIALWDFSDFDQPSARLIAQTDLYSINRQLAYSAIAEIAWSPNGNWLAVVAGFYWYTFDVSDLSFRPVTSAIGIGGETGTLDIAWSPDSTLIAAGGNGNISLYPVTQMGEIDRENRILLATRREGEPLIVPSLAWSPSGDRIVFKDILELNFRIYDIRSRTEIAVHPMPLETSVSVNWSPDGKYIAYPVYDPQTAATLLQANGSVIVVDAETWATIATYPTVSTTILTSIEWSPDSSRIAYLADSSVRPAVEAEALLRGEGDPIISIQTVQPTAADPAS